MCMKSAFISFPLLFITFFPVSYLHFYMGYAMLVHIVINTNVNNF